MSSVDTSTGNSFFFLNYASTLHKIIKFRDLQRRKCGTNYDFFSPKTAKKHCGMLSGFSPLFTMFSFLSLLSLWHRMSGGTIFLFGFEKCLWMQPYCLLGSGLVRPKSFRPWACSSYMIVRYFIDYNRSKSVIDEFNK